MELVSQLAAPILVAIITSVVTVRLSVRAFSSQRWWERKADAYSSIINALSARGETPRRTETGEAPG